MDRYLVGLVLGHLVVTIVHAIAHLSLQILPTSFDLVFIVVVITAGPVAVLPVFRFRHTLAAGLLAVLMGASFLYGFYSHFIASGPDNVALVPSEPWTVVFVATGAILGALEVAAAALAVAVVMTAARTPSEPAERLA